MFDEMVVSSPNPKKTNKPWTVVLSMIFQTAFLAVLILIPLIYTEALPKTMMATLLVAPPPPPPPPPPPIAQIVHVKPQVHLMDAGKLVTPKVIPKDIKIIKEDAPDMSNMGMQGGVVGGVAGGQMGGVIGGVIGGVGGAPPSEADANTYSPGRQRNGGQTCESRTAVVSAAGPPDAHFRNRTAARHYRKEWRGRAAGSNVRASVAGTSGAGCGAAVEVSSDDLERRAG